MFPRLARADEPRAMTSPAAADRSDVTVDFDGFKAINDLSLHASSAAA